MKKIIILIFFTIYITRHVSAESVIKINEFSIDPTQRVEIFNSGSSEIDLSNWYIDDSGGTTYFTIPPGTIIYPNSCRVFSGEINLNKSSTDTIRLFDSTAPPTASNAVLIDSFAYPSSPGVDLSYARNPDGSTPWIIGPTSFGKLNSTGTPCEVLPTITPTPSPSPTSIPSISPSPTASPIPQTSYENIYLSEALVSPESGLPEWIELYNNNDFTVNLTNWSIDDTENSGSLPKSLSVTISGKGYVAFDMQTSMFNNSGDSVRLLDFNKLVKDSFEYNTSSSGKSLGRKSFDVDEFCLQEPSKGGENSGCEELSVETAMIQTVTSSTKKITPTLSPSPMVTTHQVRDVLTKQSSIINQQPPTQPTKKLNLNQGELLGISDEQETNNFSAAVKSLSFSSFGFSLLSIISLVLKLNRV